MYPKVTCVISFSYLKYENDTIPKASPNCGSDYKIKGRNEKFVTTFFNFIAFVIESGNELGRWGFFVRPGKILIETLIDKKKVLCGF